MVGVARIELATPAMSRQRLTLEKLACSTRLRIAVTVMPRICPLPCRDRLSPIPYSVAFDL